MVRKRLDDRIRTLLERGVVTGERSFMVLVGDHGKDQVPNLVDILSKTRISARPNVLWCYKKELGFSTHRKKRMKKLQRDKARGLKSASAATASEAGDAFELFIQSTDVTWCYYKDSHRVLGRTVGALVLQDFEALTPNLLARTMETVQGGGLIVVLLRTVASLQQLYKMTMDVHARYRTDSAGDLVPRFNERFILSLADCRNCLVCDDELNVLPLSKKTLEKLGPTAVKDIVRKGEAGEVIIRDSQEDKELEDLKLSLSDTPHIGALVELAKTLDQAKAVLVFLEACSEHASPSSASTVVAPSKTIAVTAARGRGKSAALGLCLAGAFSLGCYSQMVVTAPSPENLMSLFDFCCRGLQALGFHEHMDYRLVYNNSSGRDETKCIIAIIVHKGGAGSSTSHRQVLQYLQPHETDKFATADVVAIDEAAAIPLPIVRSLLHPASNLTGSGSSTSRLTVLSSTVNGYEGTGRALSLKLLKELREQMGSRGRSATLQAARDAADAIVGPRSKKGETKVHDQRYKASAEAAQAAANDLASHQGLSELELHAPIRYAQGDPVEAWLNKLLCLDSGGSGTNGSTNSAFKLKKGAPAPGDCELYSVDRDALFSYHKLSEAFLQQVMGLYTSAHYKNTPNDLQLLSDAPAHALFVLLSPAAEQEETKKSKDGKSSISDSLPDVLAVVQVALEGKISRKAVEAQLARGHRSAGDLIPWTISQQFSDSSFAQLSGARIVRIAVHPSVQGMGYGSRAIELLYRYYNGDIVSLSNHDDDNDGMDDSGGEAAKSETEEESIGSDEEGEDPKVEGSKKSGLHAEKLTPRKELPPLLLPLTEVDTPRLDWIGTSFGMTLQLHKFWSRAGMRMLYLRQTKNELTGEHSAIMVRALPKPSGVIDTWLDAFVSDTKRRFLSLLGGPFRDMEIRLAISMLEMMDKKVSENSEKDVAQRLGKSYGKISASELDYQLTMHDLRRIELYGRNLCDHHLVSDLLPTIARLYFMNRLGDDLKLSGVQSALLCGVGIQNRDIDSLTKELGLPSNQVLAMFNKAVRKISMALNAVMEAREEEALINDKDRLKAEKRVEKMKHVSAKTLEEDVSDAAKEAMETLKMNETKSLPREIANDSDLMQYVVKGSDDQWKSALDGKDAKAATTVQIKTTREKRKAIYEDDILKEAEKDHAASKRGKSPGKRKKKGKR